MIYGVMAVAALLAWCAERKKQKVYIVLLVAVLSLFVGTRSRYVGIDTDMYYLVFLNLTRNVFSPNMERPFLLLTWILLKVLKTEYILLLYATVTNTFIIARLWTLRRDNSFVLMVILYTILFYPETANIMRQYVAIAIVFYATYCIEKNRSIPFFILVAIAAVFHRSALLGVIYYPLFYLLASKKASEKRKAVLLLCIIVPAGGVYFLLSHGGEFSFYLKYFNDSNNSFGFLYPAKFAVVMVYYLLSYKYQKDYESKIWIKRVLWSYLIGILLSSAGYFQTSLYRMGLYFMPFEAAYISYVCRNGVNRRIYSIVYSILILYFFVLGHRSGWSGLLDYSTWWF